MIFYVNFYTYYMTGRKCVTENRSHYNFRLLKLKTCQLSALIDFSSEENPYEATPRTAVWGHAQNDQSTFNPLR